jgi:hypothetical protein
VSHAAVLAGGYNCRCRCRFRCNCCCALLLAPTCAHSSLEEPVKAPHRRTDQEGHWHPVDKGGKVHQGCHCQQICQQILARFPGTPLEAVGRNGTPEVAHCEFGLLSAWAWANELVEGRHSVGARGVGWDATKGRAATPTPRSAPWICFVEVLPNASRAIATCYGQRTRENAYNGFKTT